MAQNIVIEQHLSQIQSQVQATPFPSDLDFQNFKKKPPFDIDIVICYAGEIINSNDKRNRDNQELKYSLRSISQHLPWIDRIYLVVPDTLAINLQHDKLFPSWLDHTKLLSNDIQIHFIAQSSIFHMQQNGMNNHNSNALEMNIMRIPNLSEHFIYMNDDFFIGKPLTWKYFFNPDTYLPRWPLNHYMKYYKMDNFDRPRFEYDNVYNYMVPGLDGYPMPKRVEYYATHAPRSLTKSMLSEYIDNMYPEYFAFMESHKSRWCSSPTIWNAVFSFNIKYFFKLLKLWITRSSYYDTNDCTHEETLFLSLLKSYLSGELEVDIMKDPDKNQVTNYYIYGITLEEKCEAIHKLKPYTFNINDDFETSDNSVYNQQVNYLHQCLEKYFPAPTIWENDNENT